MIQLSMITCSLAGRTILHEASTRLPDRSKIGIVGRNGEGKTTLFRLICGEIELQSGEIILSGKPRIGRVVQEAPAGPHSLLETVLSADTERSRLIKELDQAPSAERIADIHARLADIDHYSAEARAAALLSGLGFDHDSQHRPCSDFSGGWRMRVALAAILFSRSDILLLDEPTNYLDLEATVWLENYLARFEGQCLIISHDRELLNRCVGSILHLERGKLRLYQGNFDQFSRQRQSMREMEEKSAAKSEKQRAHLQKFIDRFGAKASKAKQAKSREKMLQKLNNDAPVLDRAAPAICFPKPKKPLGSPLMRLEGVSAGYANKPVLSEIDLSLDRQARIALIGANGNGKSTLAKLLAGRIDPLAGRLERTPGLDIGYFSQHQMDELVEEKSALEHVQIQRPLWNETLQRRALANFGLQTDIMTNRVSTLSGGEKARLLMGLANLDAPQLIILDEPTNHLDIDARSGLCDAINRFDGAVILVSHDRYLIESCTQTLWLVAQGKVISYEGDLSDYRQQIMTGARGAGEMDNIQNSPIPNGPGHSGDGLSVRARRQAAAKQRQIHAPLKSQIRKLEKNIENLTKLVDRLDAQLSDGTLYREDIERATKLAQERAGAVSKRAQAEEEWLELSAHMEISQQQP